MMHFPPVSDFPLFSKKFQTLRKIFTMLPFPDKFLDFHPPKFLMTFPPYFNKFSPVLDKFTCFLHTLRVFRFPPTLTMMHLCIIQCTYWTPLDTLVGVEVQKETCSDRVL